MTGTDPGPSDATTATGATAGAATAEPPPPAEPERGRLTIAPAVVRKIAERAADDVPATVRRGRDGATVRVSGEESDVDLAAHVAIRYPSPVRAAAAAIRAGMVADVQRMTGYRVRSVRVVVAALLPDRPSGRVR